MRLFSALCLLLALTACDSGPADGDLDLGDFRGSDASIQADISGGAFHGLADAEAGGLAAVPLRFELGAAERGGRTVTLSVPLDGRLISGTYPIPDGGAEANAWASDRTAVPAVQEMATGGTVTIGEIRRGGTYADVFGTVEIEFPSGSLTGTFRAVDQSRPTPGGGCDRTRTVCSYY